MEAKCLRGPRIIWYEDKSRHVAVVCAICSHDAVQRKLDWVSKTLRESLAGVNRVDTASVDADQQVSTVLVDASSRTPLKVASPFSTQPNAKHIVLLLFGA